MKKLFISLMTVGALLASCTNFDEPTAKTFAEGPAVEISQAVIADSTFTFTVTPAAGTNYYTYVVCEGTDVMDIDAESLLKDQIEGVISECNTTKNTASVTVNMRDAANAPLAKPNTDYVIYAVAGSADGVPGKVKSQQVKTSDKICPFIKSSKAGDNNIELTFDDVITRGTGAITAQYFIEWESKFVDIPADDITVKDSANVVTLSAANVPANCYVLWTLETGAYKDGAGNNSEANAWGVSSKGTFTGIFYQQTADVLPFDNTNIVSPAAGIIKDATQPVVIDFGQDVYAGTSEDAVIKVIYTGTGKTTIYDVTEYVIEGQKLTFYLPDTPAENDVISFIVEEGIVADKYGNENEETALAEVYKYSTVSWKQIGTYTYTYSIIFGNDDGSPYVDSGCPIYQNEDNASQYKLAEWGDGSDFIFTVKEDGTITWDAFTINPWDGYYGKVVIYDLNTVYGEKFAPSKYDAATGVFSFNLLYYFADQDWYYYDQTGAAPETMTINVVEAKAISKSVKKNHSLPSLNKKNLSFKAPWK